MEIALSVVLLIALLLIFLLVQMRRKTTVTIDGCTIEFHLDRDFVWVVYSEPSGRTLTLEAHDWQGPGNQPEVLVDFPSEISFNGEESNPVKNGTTKLDVSNTPSSPISKEQAILVQGRISAGLTRLKIQHKFARPKRSGWTSFEEGKEIYHG
jgi:hypothetical protein